MSDENDFLVFGGCLGYGFVNSFYIWGKVGEIFWWINRRKVDVVGVEVCVF